jgi:RNA polymerase sigma-70 factor (ECF subfamily)
VTVLEPSDLELVRSAARGDAGAFHVLVDRHSAGLFRLAMSLSGSRSDAEDICQETFAAAYRGLAGFNAQASVKTWLSRILMRRAAKVWNKERYARRTVSIYREPDENGRCDMAPGKLAERLSVAAATTGVEQRMDVMEMIRSLPAEFRDVILLREVDGLSYQEIAEAMNIPRGTVESRLHRARAELRRKLKGY